MNDFFHLCQTGYNLRGHKYVLATTRSRLEVQCYFFSQRVMRPWNQWPDNVVEATIKFNKEDICCEDTWSYGKFV